MHLQKPKHNNKVESLKPNGQRAKNAITLIWIVLVVEVASLISGYFQYDLIQTLVNGGEITDAAADANDNREQVIGIIYMIVFFVSAVTFIQWFRRAYYNLHQKIDNLSYGEGWAAGAWFVPILNLFRPYQIMKELFVETKKLLTQQGLGVSKNIVTSSLGLWWTLWILNNVIGQFVFRYSKNAETLDQLSIMTIASMVANLVGIPLALVAIKVTKDYASVEPYLDELKDEDEILTHLVGYAQ